ncbi:MAG: trigger factor family protein [Bacteroidales bacterium]|nr:trigger factor family protein [Bacteroidales bacterium]
MSVIREASGDLTAILKVQISESDYSGKIDKALSDYRKKASINGFRPGKAPMGIIKKTYGHYALVDTVNELVYDKLNEYIETEKIEILGQPIPSEEQQATINWENDKNFEFAFEIGLKPQINLDTTLVSSINYYKISAKEEMMVSHIDYLRNRFGS